MSEKNEIGIMPYMGMGVFILLTAVIALLLATPFEATGVKAFEDPGSIWNPIYFILLIIGFTAVVLIVIRFGGKRLVYIVMLAAVAITMYYVLDGIFRWYHPASNSVLYIYGIELNTWALVITSLLTIMLHRYPEWYVVDVTGLMLSGGAAAIFGISLIPPLVIVLMILLAFYDAISVYKTRHMVSLAESVVDMNVPILFVLPRKRDFSMLRKNTRGLGSGDALFMGLGDAVIPTILVVSVYVSYDSMIPALCALAGTLAGYTALTRLAGRGKPHAGLPFLNSGAIIGFFIGLLIIMGAG